MIVKKVNPNWQPIENPHIKVGDTIEITDPKDLIVNGSVVALDSDGNDVSAYDLYGIITSNEREDFEAYLREKRQTQVEKALKRNNESLKKQLDQTAVEKATGGESKTVTEQKAKEVVKPKSEPKKLVSL